MLDQSVDFDEGAGIEQQIDPLVRRELARLVLSLDALLAAAGPRALHAIVQLVELGGVGGHDARGL